MLHYAITAGTLRSPADFPSLIDRIKSLHHIDFLLLREPHLPPAGLLSLARRVKPLLPPSTRLLLHSRLDLALAAGADGLHLPAAPGQLTPAQIRTLLPGAIVSQSCHTYEEVAAARHAGVDFVLFAPVFGKTVFGKTVFGESVSGHQVTAPAGLDALAEACRLAAGVRVLALGGVTPANAPQCLAAGAAGIAGIRLFFP